MPTAWELKMEIPAKNLRDVLLKVTNYEGFPSAELNAAGNEARKKLSRVQVD